MTGHHVPRIPTINSAFVQERLMEFMCSVDTGIERIQADPGKLVQIRHASLASNWKCIGLYRYALGFPIEEIKHAFKEAGNSYLVVFRFRGTESGFPVTILTIDPEKSPRDPSFVVDSRPCHSPDTKDFSLTNSRTGLEAMCLSLIAKEEHLAQTLADLVWDPVNAPYIGPESEVCTPNEQHFAYSVKHLLRREQEHVTDHVQQFKTTKRERWLVGVQKMLQGIVERNGQIFTEGLRQLLSEHHRVAKKPSNSWKTELYLSVYGLALSILAVHHKIVSVDELPHEDIYLPIELLS